MALFNLHPNCVTDILRAPLVVVIPIYNEAETIGSVVADWTRVLADAGIDYQMILVNDGSKDNTLAVLDDLQRCDPDHLVVVDKPNAGHGRTCRLGYSAAVAAPAVEWIFQIDSDGQCDPQYFREFWEAKDGADCVFGQRVQRDDGVVRALTSKICKLGATILGGRDMVDPNVPYRLMNKATLAKALERIPASFDIHNVAVTFVLKRMPEVRWKHVPIRFRDRQGGSNSINVLNVALLGISMIFDLRKLRCT